MVLPTPEGQAAAIPKRNDGFAQVPKSVPRPVKDKPQEPLKSTKMSSTSIEHCEKLRQTPGKTSSNAATCPNSCEAPPVAPRSCQREVPGQDRSRRRPPRPWTPLEDRLLLQEWDILLGNKLMVLHELLPRRSRGFIEQRYHQLTTAPEYRKRIEQEKNECFERHEQDFDPTHCDALSFSDL